MAPTRPRKRSTKRTKTSSSIPPSSSLTMPLAPATKQSKRLEKHVAFLSRIKKPHEKPLKRRRPSKKLVTTMNSLVDALPYNEISAERKELNNNKNLLKSLKIRPGVMKRKLKLEKDEKLRFDKNLVQIIKVGQESSDPINVATPKTAQLVAQPVSTLRSNNTAIRFAAIRAWASVNIEKHPDFKKKL